MTAPPVSPEAFFLSADDGGKQGQRFCVYHSPPNGQLRGALLYVHPFAEEMNKSRRMAALQSRALALAGYGVLQIDLRGCGDSSGEFADATWQSWIDDVLLGCEWLRRQSEAPLWLWGLRAGCLVAAAAARQIETACNFLFWQPAIQGKAVLQQFLRLKLASDVSNGRVRGTTQAMRLELESGNAVEVAGYEVDPRLALGLERATLEVPGCARRLEWIEVSTRDGAALSPMSETALDAWQHAGALVRSRVVAGVPAFWQSAEIEEPSQAVTATLAALDDPRVP